MDNSTKKIYTGMKRVLLYGLLLVAMSIQAQELLPYPTDTIDGKVYYRYTVEKSIGLYRISKNFGVTQEAILKANPELKERGLHYDETILIPTDLPATPQVTEMKVEPEVSPAVVETAKVEEAPAAEAEPKPTEQAEQAERTEVSVLPELSESAEQTDFVAYAEYTDTLRLSYLLPLQANTIHRNPTIDRFYDFYAGSLLALKHHEATYTDSNKNRHSTYYDIRTYDIQKGEQVIQQLIDSGALAESDVIIGPAYSKQVATIAPYAQEKNIPVIVPFLSSIPDVQTNPSIWQFNPSDEVETHELMEHLDTLRTQINIVLVDAGKVGLPTSVRTLRDSIAARRLPTTRATIRQILADSISSALVDSVENILLFHSERYSNVQLLMPYLLSGKHGKQLTIMSYYAWQNEHIILPQLFTGVFRAPDSDAMKQYEQDFAQYFAHTPASTNPRYDLLGYDLTRYLLEALQGGSLKAKEELYEGLQSSILFTPLPNGGYENTHIIINRR